MARARRSHPTRQPVPQYAWAFDAAGHAVPIGGAERGTAYVCPICGGAMIARLGSEVRHHFAHVEQQHCPAEAVAHAAGVRWIAGRLRGHLAARQSVTASWTCPLCGQIHTANLLAGAVTVCEDFRAGDLHLDVALLDAAGGLRAGIVLAAPGGIDAAPGEGYAPLITVSPAHLWRNAPELPALLAGASITGGLCTIQQAAAEAGYVVGGDALRQIILDAVSVPPHRLYGLLEAEESLTHVLTVGRRKLWLPPVLWQRTIGGVRHKVAPGFMILSQEWERLDGSIIALYYVTVKDAHAIAVRRFPPGEPVTARLGQATLRTPRLSALQVARSLAEN